MVNSDLESTPEENLRLTQKNIEEELSKGKEFHSLEEPGWYKGDGFTQKIKKSLFKTIYHILLIFFLIFLLFISLTCCILVVFFHSHLLLECSYAELMIILLLEVIIFIFCVYQSYSIYRYFFPEKKQQKEQIAQKYGIDEDFEDDDDDEEEENDFENSWAMKLLFFVLKGFGLIISIGSFLLLILFTISTITYQQLTLPQYSGRLIFNELTTKTIVHREPNGVIHITTEDFNDLYFAQGVVSAQERTWQLEFSLRVVEGRLSELVGSGGLSVDKLSRTLDYIGKAKLDTEYIKVNHPKEYGYLQKYCDGINAYNKINSHIPPEFTIFRTSAQKWEVHHIVAYSKVISWLLGNNAKMEVLRYKLLRLGLTKERIDEIFPVLSDVTILTQKDLGINISPEETENLRKKFENDDGAYIPKKASNQQIKNEKIIENEIKKNLKNEINFLNPTNDLKNMASNNWVVSGNKTSSGKPYLCNDPHLPFGAPGVFLLMHLSCLGHSSMGGAFPQMPGIMIGKNKKISWGITAGMADQQDLYVMKDVIVKNFTEPTKYLYGGFTKDYKHRKEVIKVAGAKDFVLNVKESDLGPVINDYFNLPDFKTNDPTIVLSWVLMRNRDPSVVGLLKLHTSNNWEEFKNNLKDHKGPSLNFVFADFNSIGEISPALVPIRKVGHSGRYPVSGDGSFEYTGYIPFEHMPMSRNQEKGYFASANNRQTPPGYNYSISLDWGSKYRAGRIEEVLKNGTSFTIDQMQDLQNDVKSNVFEDFKPFFIQMKPKIKTQKWIEKLINWDGKENGVSQEAALFELWLGNLKKLTEAETKQKGGVGDIKFFLNALKKGNDTACINNDKKTKNCMDFAVLAFTESLEQMDEDFGGSLPTWGSDIHEAYFEHPILDKTPLTCLASRNIHTLGGTDTLNQGKPLFPELTQKFGAVYRQIIQMGEDSTLHDHFIIPLGQSGNWLSRYYSNYLGQWRNGQLLKMDMTNFDKGFELHLH